jgi:hypothetical protein
MEMKNNIENLIIQIFNEIISEFLQKSDASWFFSDVPIFIIIYV